MTKRKDGQPMCLARGCRRARREGAHLCSHHFADQLWAEAVKLRDERCRAILYPGIFASGCKGRLEADHLISRSYGATRWLLDTGATLCLGHHKFVTEHPLEHEELASMILGADRYVELRRLALSMAVEDPEEAIERLRRELKALGGARR
jgi:hypothetical protein